MSNVFYSWFQAIFLLLLFLVAMLLAGLFYPEFFNIQKLGFLWTDYTWRAGILAVLIGGGVGAIELVGRYQDAPFQAVLARGAVFYIFVNSFISLISFVGLLIYVSKYSGGTEVLTTMLEAAAIAGFGSLAVMRTAIAKTQIGGNDVSVGPSFFIDVLLKAADRSVDRHRAIHRLGAVPAALEPIKDIDFNINDLFLICSNSLQNLEVGERETVNQRMNELAELARKDELEPEMVRLVGGMRLQQMVGSDAFTQACQAIIGMNFNKVVSQDALAVFADAPPAPPQSAASAPSAKPADFIGPVRPMKKATASDKGVHP